MEKGLQISVSGVRGRYPDFLTSSVAKRFGLAFGSYVRSNRVFICRDTRISGESLKNAIATGLLCAGKDVADIGIAATPELGYVLEKIEKSPGVVVTASHNPGEYNGIKFLTEAGVFLNSAQSSELLGIYNNKSFHVAQDPGCFSSRGYTEKYFEAIYGVIDASAVRRRKFRVVVDACQGVGAFMSEPFLQGLGCEVEVINREPAGVFSHNPEPLPENLLQLSAAVLKNNADIGFAQDPDGDRLAVVCENGSIPGEEMTVVLCIVNILENYGKGPVVVNLSTTSLVEEVAKKLGVAVYRTRIGEINVVERMKECGAVIGGEGNGGVICPNLHYGRDSFVGMAVILDYLVKRGKKLSEITGALPKFHMLKEKLVVDGDKKDFLLDRLMKEYGAKEEVNIEDGIKIIRRGGWVHVRPSGTEPVLRIYAEAGDIKTAEEYLAEFTAYFSSD